MLDFLEDGTRGKFYDDRYGWWQQPKGNFPILFGYMPVWNCPSDISQRMENDSVGSMDYKANYGVNWAAQTNVVSTPALKGPFYWSYGARFRDITDGCSKTYAMLEMLQAPALSGQAIDRRGRVWNDDSSCYQLSTDLSPNSLAPDRGTCANRPEIG